jgi:transposase
MDLGKKRSDVCVMEDALAVSERFQCSTTAEGLRKAFGTRAKAEIAIESCRDARWVFELLTALGHEVVVVDTSRVRSIGVGRGRRKTDRRDAEALARALWTPGVVPRAHVLSRRCARLRDVLSARAQLVGQRRSLVTMLRGQWQAQGLQAPRCSTRKFEEQLRAMQQDAVHATHVQGSLAVLKSINEQITVIEVELANLAEGEECYERLSSVPAVKLIVATAFIAAIDAPERFRNAHEVQAYLGLVPSERSSGGKRRLGGITKAGNKMARHLLVQSAHTLMRMPRCENNPLVVWAKQVAERRGKRIAIVAIARRLAGILWAMWMDGTFYDAQGLGRASADGLSRRARRAHKEAAEMHRTLVKAA